MKVSVDKDRALLLEEVYNGIGLKTRDGECMGICMRDTGFEFNYQGTWYEAKNGTLKLLGDTKRIDGDRLDMEDNALMYKLFGKETDMPTGKSLEFAINMALMHHAGQKDKAGLPVILHPLKVMSMLSDYPLIFQIVAVLHDVVEDTHVTLKHIQEHGFSKEVVDAVDAITRKEKPKERYKDYIKRVKKNNIATIVKLTDIRHNTSPGRINSIPDRKEAMGLMERWDWAYKELHGFNDSEEYMKKMTEVMNPGRNEFDG